MLDCCNNHCATFNATRARALKVALGSLVLIGGWLFCLVLLAPQPLRSALLPPLAANSLLASALRVEFGAHHLSDVVLGWGSSLVVFVGLRALADSPQREKKLKFE
jgi:lipid A 4'-phosphatase